MDKGNVWSVYVHINRENGKRYVGITSSEPERRWGYKGRNYNHNPHFHMAIDKYGWGCFEHIIIWSGLTEQEAKSEEIRLIAEWKSMDSNYGYNMTLGGDGTKGCYPSEETRRKLSESRRRENLSEETRKRKSEAMHNRRLSEDHKRKIGKGNSKPINMFDISGNYIRTFSSAKDAEVELGINHSHISQCCTGKRNSTGGYIWKFA